MVSPRKMGSEELVDSLVNKIHKHSSKWDVAKLDILEKKMQTAAALIRGARNNLQPINRLPPELLAVVFRETQQRLPGFLPIAPDRCTLHHDWLRLLTVCRHWRGICATYHVLWSNIDSGYMPTKCLKRSADTPLTVTFGIRNQFPVPEQEHLNAILEHTHRIHEFHIDPWRLRPEVPSPTQPVRRLLTSPAPKLVSLTLLSNDVSSNWGGGWPGINPPGWGAPTITTTSHLESLFDGCMPRLRELCLEHYTSWPSGYFHNLTRLCLYKQSFGTTRPTTASFLDFLEHSPLLETLVLVFAGPDRPPGDDTPPVSPGRVVCLERLREVDIGGVRSIHFVTRLLEHLQLLPDTSLYIWGDSTLLDTNQELSTLFPTSKAHLQNLHSIKEYRYIRDSYRRHRSSTTHLVSVVDDVLVVKGDYTVSQINNAMKCFPLLGATTVSFDDTTSSSPHNSQSAEAVVDIMAWRTAFESLTSLENLILRGQNKSTTESMLSALYPSHDQDPALLCPNLNTIRIEGRMQDIPAFYLAILAEERAKFGAPIMALQIVSLRPFSRPPSSGSTYVPIHVQPFAGPEKDDDPEELVDMVAGSAPEYAQKTNVMRRQIRDVSFLTVRRHVSRLPKSWPTQGHKWHQACDNRRGIIGSPW